MVIHCLAIEAAKNEGSPTYHRILDESSVTSDSMLGMAEEAGRRANNYRKALPYDISASFLPGGFASRPISHWQALVGHVGRYANHTV